MILNENFIMNILILNQCTQLIVFDLFKLLRICYEIGNTQGIVWNCLNFKVTF